MPTQTSLRTIKRVCDAIAEIDRKHGSGYAVSHRDEILAAIRNDTATFYPMDDIIVSRLLAHRKTVSGAEVLEALDIAKPLSRDERTRVTDCLERLGWV
jgi:hypothetical protein